MRGAFHNAQGLIKDSFKYLTLKEFQDSILQKVLLTHANILDHTGLVQKDLGSCFILTLFVSTCSNFLLLFRVLFPHYKVRGLNLITSKIHSYSKDSHVHC